MTSGQLGRRQLTDDIVVVDDFVTPEARAEILKELAFAFWRPSLAYQRQGDNVYRHVRTDTRVSETAHYELFGDALIALLRPIEDSLRTIFGVAPECLEWWQATRYGVGGRFDPHLDAGYWDDHYAGDRVRTFLLFLDTPGSGGGTYFRALDTLVDAIAGRLVVWENLFPDGSPNHRMIHAGSPVREGVKTTLVTWERQRRFRGANDGDPGRSGS